MYTSIIDTCYTIQYTIQGVADLPYFCISVWYCTDEDYYSDLPSCENLEKDSPQYKDLLTKNKGYFISSGQRSTVSSDTIEFAGTTPEKMCQALILHVAIQANPEIVSFQSYEY